jgi:hypothetical protein
MNGDLVFVHIPKTAGTAFRQALKAATPHYVHLADYGRHQPVTSPEIKASRYGKPRREELHFRDMLPTEKPVLVSGHIPAALYARNFAESSFITFLRDPIARTLSEYKHFVRLKDFTGSLTEFLQRPGQRNKQSNFLKNVDLSSFLFIGLAETYADDLSAFAKLTQLKLKNLSLNAAPKDQLIELSPADRQLLEDVNADDLALYERVKALRRDGWRPRSPAGPIKAEVSVLPNGDIAGWAVAEGGRRAVTLTVSAAGREVGRITCDAYRPELRARQLSATGVGGFAFSPKALGVRRGPIALSAGDWRFEARL